MFDEYEEETYYEPEPVYTEEQINSRLKELRKEKRKLKIKKGLYIAGSLFLVGGLGLTPGTIGIASGIQCGHSPLKKDDVVRQAHIKTVFSSDGEVETSKRYAPYENEKSEMRYYSNWIKNGNKYVTCESTYDVTGLTYDDVDGLMKIKGIESEPFGKPVAERIITKESVSDEELAKGSHYEGVIYLISNDDYVVTPQTTSENNEDIMGYLVVPGTVGLIPGCLGTFLAAYSDAPDKIASASYRLIDTKREIKEFEDKKKKLTKKL